MVEKVPEGQGLTLIRLRLRSADLASARTEAGSRWRIKPTDDLEVRLKYRTAGDGVVDGSAETLPPSTPRDAHIVKVAFEILEWSREDIRSHLRTVKRSDLDNLLHGRTSGAVKAEVFRVLNDAGADIQGIEKLIDRANEHQKP